MTRAVVRPEAIEAGRVRFDHAEAHHLARVRRLRPGAVIEVTDGAGRILAVRLESVVPENSWGTVLGPGGPLAESPCAITLGVALLKGERMTWVIQKATELGVARIVPILSRRVVAQAPAERREDRRARWQRVAREAVKQCGRAMTPPVDPVRSFEELAGEAADHDRAWLLWEGGGVPLAAAARIGPRPRRLLLVVGPEGGFAPEEVTAARSCGILPVGLGRRILRAESAAVIVTALAQYLFGDLGGEESVSMEQQS